MVLSWYQTLWEFGVKETPYANYQIVVVGEIAIRFYLSLVEKASPFIPNSRNLA